MLRINSMNSQDSPAKSGESDKPILSQEVATGIIGITSGIVALGVSDSKNAFIAKAAKPIGWASIALGSVVLLKTFLGKKQGIPIARQDNTTEPSR
jgi:hypothetical protein